jgi:hypothetical protein
MLVEREDVPKYPNSISFPKVPHQLMADVLKYLADDGVFKRELL